MTPPPEVSDAEPAPSRPRSANRRERPPIRRRDGLPTVTLVAILKNEAPYVDEWIEAHRLIGFDAMILYDNASTDGTGERLAAHAGRGVRVIDWPDRPERRAPPQIAAYRHATARLRTEWAAFFDGDEFLNLHKHDSVGAMLAEIPPEAEAVGVSWRVFGSSGAIAASAEPVTERFVRAAPAAMPANTMIKTIARTDRLVRMAIHKGVFLSHQHDGDPVGRYVTPSGRPMVFGDNGRPTEPEWETAQLNHYVVKSREEFAAKMRRGRAAKRSGGADKFYSDEEASRHFRVHDRNDEEDRSLLDLLARLRGAR
ncbi:glycosyltransferase family 2 protein [Acuticoccus mangrovi]|uniref:Glycosyltransferase family 2 protein n=1 Tax=Acuticoccus mangrovi TaxID=2796142 RepID=A0A934IMB5_9HYPH|nr:glycosyltransferase family 2 protein [Acuticoccus mangrovi]MBJ3776462.1 glycosyltransferase family 2 protein [Acuticoccus mangrovi]